MITVSQNLSHCGADSGYPHKTRKLKAMVFSALHPRHSPDFLAGASRHLNNGGLRGEATEKAGSLAD